MYHFNRDIARITGKGALEDFCKATYAKGSLEEYFVRVNGQFCGGCARLFIGIIRSRGLEYLFNNHLFVCKLITIAGLISFFYS